MTNPLSHTIALIASGATDWQQSGRLQGNTDLPLSSEAPSMIGDQAARHNLPRPVRVIHCAPDEASRQTADLYAARLGEAKVKPVDALSEVDLGLWQGLTEQQLADRYARAYAQWHSDPAHVSAPEGEELADAADRLTAAISKLVPRSTSEPLVLVLRPLALNICAAWLAGEPVGSRLFAKNDEPVHTIRLTEDGARAIRGGRRRKALLAASMKA